MSLLTTPQLVRARAALLGCAVLAGLMLPLRASAVPEKQFPTSTCFWQGPIEPSRAEFNIAFPDAKAVYWTAEFALPEGASLSLDGAYGHGRYLSFNSYDQAGSPTDAIHDVQIAPNAGSSNPYLPDAKRSAKNRDYEVMVLNESPPADPADRAENTLYAAVAGQTRQALVYRLYVPDKNRDLTGGVGLPEVTLTLADGSVLTGEALCDLLQARDTILSTLTLPLALYNSLRNQPGKPETFPALDPPVFHRHFTVNHTVGCLYLGACGGAPPVSPGQYANIDNAYIIAQVNRGFGPVLVLRGKAPTTPPTFQRDPKFEGETQLRYWSMCQNESLATTRGAGCLYDEQVPLDDEGNYTIVTSLAADRPSNATTQCGVGWVPWPENGDGVSHPDDGLLILRNMLPAPTFPNAIQDIMLPGEEAAVMGPYLPVGEYTTKADFEALGCK